MAGCSQVTWHEPAAAVSGVGQRVRGSLAEEGRKHLWWRLVPLRAHSLQTSLFPLLLLHSLTVQIPVVFGVLLRSFTVCIQPFAVAQTYSARCCLSVNLV
ncbi:hypothetical protein TRVL_05046 [Trypanosoma vivax]|nr:hypothetical protein TRVL_05046 [Trypanosoma vivax]